MKSVAFFIFLSMIVSPTGVKAQKKVKLEEVFNSKTEHLKWKLDEHIALFNNYLLQISDYGVQGLYNIKTKKYEDVTSNFQKSLPLKTNSDHVPYYESYFYHEANEIAWYTLVDTLIIIRSFDLQSKKHNESFVSVDDEIRGLLTFPYPIILSDQSVIIDRYILAANVKDTRVTDNINISAGNIPRDIRVFMRNNMFVIDQTPGIQNPIGRGMSIKVVKIKENACYVQTVDFSSKKLINYRVSTSFDDLLLFESKTDPSAFILYDLVSKKYFEFVIDNDRFKNGAFKQYDKVVDPDYGTVSDVTFQFSSSMTSNSIFLKQVNGADLVVFEIKEYKSILYP